MIVWGAYMRNKLIKDAKKDLKRSLSIENHLTVLANQQEMILKELADLERKLVKSKKPENNEVLQDTIERV